MNIDLITVLTYAALPLILTMGSFIVKSLFNRLDSLESKMASTTTEAQVRQIVSDRYDPLAQDIRDIKEYQEKLDSKLDKLFDLYINTHKGD